MHRFNIVQSEVFTTTQSLSGFGRHPERPWEHFAIIGQAVVEMVVLSYIHGL